MLELQHVSFEVNEDGQDKGILHDINLVIPDGNLTVCGGGRYDNLVSQIGGPDLPAVGFGMGIERVLMLMDSEGIPIPEPERYDLFVTYMGNNRMKAFSLVQKLRRDGFKADMDHCGRSLKAQFKFANKTGTKWTGVIGDDEAASDSVKLKNMSTGEETTVPAAKAEIILRQNK